jgi:sulfoxide reductase heme-binding subunit YedZ
MIPPRKAERRLDSPHVLWFLLALPGIVMLFDYLRGATFYGEVVHATGELAAQLLIVTLAITPLRALFPQARWLRWLAQRRRYFGVAVFGYTALHAAVYLVRLADLGRSLGDAATAAMATGWVALAILLALAVTSNDASVRRLRRKWRWLHRTVYVAALLTFTHWVLAAFDPVPGYIHLGVLLALESLRLVAPLARKLRARTATAE